MHQHHLWLNALLKAQAILLKDLKNAGTPGGNGQRSVLLHFHHLIFPWTTSHGFKASVKELVLLFCCLSKCSLICYTQLCLTLCVIVLVTTCYLLHLCPFTHFVCATCADFNKHIQTAAGWPQTISTFSFSYLFIQKTCAFFAFESFKLGTCKKYFSWAC